MKFLKFFILVNLCLILIFSFTVLSFAENTAYVWSNNSSSINTFSPEENSNSLNLESGSAILIEQTTRSNSICT